MDKIKNEAHLAKLKTSDEEIINGKVVKYESFKEVEESEDVLHSLAKVLG